MLIAATFSAFKYHQSSSSYSQSPPPYLISSHLNPFYNFNPPSPSPILILVSHLTHVASSLEILQTQRSIKFLISPCIPIFRLTHHPPFSYPNTFKRSVRIMKFLIT